MQVNWQFLIFPRQLQYTIYSSDLQFLFLSRLKTMRNDFLNIYSPCNSSSIVLLFFLHWYNARVVTDSVCTCVNGAGIPFSGGSHVSCRLDHFDSFGSVGVGGWCQAVWVKLQPEWVGGCWSSLFRAGVRVWVVVVKQCTLWLVVQCVSGAAVQLLAGNLSSQLEIPISGQFLGFPCCSLVVCHEPEWLVVVSHVASWHFVWLF